MKKGNVTLVFEKGRKEQLGSYSLFTITLVLGKVTEWIIMENI